MTREQEILEGLAAQDNLRSLKTLRAESPPVYHSDGHGGEKGYCNLSSNDYLGLTDPALQRRFLLSADAERFLLGNPSSRLMTGNSPAYERLEETLARLQEPRPPSCWDRDSPSIPAYCLP